MLDTKQQGIIRVFLAYRVKFGKEAMDMAVKDYAKDKAHILMQHIEKAWAVGNRGAFEDIRGL